ncbi:MAG: ATP-binding protein [Candidatus Saccharimonadales bacterium]
MAALNRLDYQTLFKALPEAYLVLLADAPAFTIVDANQAYLDISGQTAKALEGQAFFKAFRPGRAKAQKADAKLLAESLQRAAAGNQPDSPDIAAFWLSEAAKARYGAWRIVHYPLPDSGGRQPLIVQTLENLGAQKRLKDNLNFLLEASQVLSTSLDDKKVLKNIAQLAVPGLADWCAVDFVISKNNLKQVAIIHKNPERLERAKAYRRQQKLDMKVARGVPSVIRTGQAEFYPNLNKLKLPASQRKLLDDFDIDSIIIAPLIVNRQPIGAITLVRGAKRPAYTQADLALAQSVAARASLAMTNAQLYGATEKQLKQRKSLQAKLKDANRRLENRVRQRTSQLQTSNQQLQRSNQELQDFAYIASHDLREPLRKIQAFGNLLEAEFANQLPDGHDYLNRMLSAASRMNVLIEDLLSFSRVATKAQPFALVNLNTIAEEVIGDLETRLLESRGRVELAKLPTISADATQMRQLLQNLIANSLKFARPGVNPIVKVYSQNIQDDNGKITDYQLFVSDNGIGFDEKYLDRIFTVFQRLHGRETYEGTGIGLAVCRKIAERHGGQITASSRPGQGACFIITLPINPKPKEVPK